MQIKVLSFETKKTYKDSLGQHFKTSEKNTLIGIRKLEKLRHINKS
jgi:hypothetical protein